MRTYNIHPKDQEDNMVFSDCISNVQDVKSEDGANASCSGTDYHTAYEKSEHCHEEESNLMTNDHTIENTDSMSESNQCLTDRNTTINQESFIGSSRRASITDSQVDIDFVSMDQVMKKSALESQPFQPS